MTPDANVTSKFRKTEKVQRKSVTGSSLADFLDPPVPPGGFLSEAQRKVRWAHRSSIRLAEYYRCAWPHGSQEVDPATTGPSTEAFASALLAEFDQASPTTMREFAVLLASAGAPDDFPVRLGDRSLPIDLPEPLEALSILVSMEDWAGMSDAREAATMRIALEQNLRWIAANAQEFDLAPQSLINAYVALADDMPETANLIELDAFGTIRNAQSAASRVISDISCGRVDALTEGLAHAVGAWLGRHIYDDLTAENIVQLRAKSGLSQKAMAERIGVDSRHYKRLEAGVTAISPALAKAIVGACETALKECRDA